MRSSNNQIKSNVNINTFLLITMVIGIVLTLIYIFYTSTAFFTSDTVITDVLAHQQRMHKQLILSNWYYGNEFWLFSLTVPTYLLSFFIKNNLLLRQISVLITAIIFFILLYIYGKKFLDKSSRFVLIAIFLTGVSYSVLDYFYCFNAYLTVIINSMILLYCYYKCFIDKSTKKIYFFLSLILTFLYSVGSLRYLPSVTAPFIFTYFFIIFIKYHDKDLKKKINTKLTIKILILVIVATTTLIVYYFLINKYHFETRAPSGEYIEASSENVFTNISAFIDCIFNFFGFDNRVHPYTFMVGKNYFLDWTKNYATYSFAGIFRSFKILICLIFMVLAPITLVKKWKTNDEKINFLLIFNISSWIIMIYLYIFSDSFFHNYSELKYFLFNIVISIILALYCIYKYYCISKNVKILINIFMIIYIISNLYTTFIVISEHDKEEINKRYDLVETLKENNLTFGYGDFWTGLLTNFLSDYKIEVASVELGSSIMPYKWYADENLYDRYYHNGETFLIMSNEQYHSYYKLYIKDYGRPNDVINSKDYYILVYESNPFKKLLD